MAKLDEDVKGLDNIPIEEKKKEWFLLLKPIILKLQNLSEASSEAALINVLGSDSGARNWKTLRHLIAFGLTNVKNFKKIFSRISSKIHSAVEGNEIINSMLAEVRVVPLLKLLGFDDLAYIRENGLDFHGQLNNEPYKIEVTYVDGPNFKTQKEVFPKPNHSASQYYRFSGVFKLTTDKLINRLRSKHDEKRKQIEKYHIQEKVIIIILTDLLETDRFWLEDLSFNGKHPIQAFVDDCTIPIIVFGAGHNSYFSAQLAYLSSRFCKDEYLRLAYGVNVSDFDVENVREQVEKNFWQGYNQKH